MPPAVVCFALLTLAQAPGPPAFRVGIEMPNQVPVSPAVLAALREMGIGYLNYYVNTHPDAPDLPPEQVNEEMLKLCDDLGADYSLACHMFEAPAPVIETALARGRREDGSTRFRGVVFDEIEHVGVLHHWALPDLADTAEAPTLPEAYDRVVAGYRAYAERYAGMGSPVTATHVFPVLLHAAAEAGWTPCPKICKEFYSPVSLAIGMGAALEYDRDLWADCDLWFWDLVPGHPAEEFRSNLLLAYWLGVDLVYVEGCGYNLKPAGQSGIPFSLMTQTTESTYQLTPHGEVLRWFAREYVPSHPRPWTFRDVRPEMAIVRFDDGDYGQRYSSGWPDDLLGSKLCRSNRDTEAWFGLWNVLTGGKTGRDGITYMKTWVAPTGYQRPVQDAVTQSYLSRPFQAESHPFFSPLRGLVVFDHKVGYDRLKGIPLLFVTGTTLSDETWEAVRRCVREGALCIGWGPLLRARGFEDWTEGVRSYPDGEGRLILTDDFGYFDVYKEFVGRLVPSDEIRYRFGEHTVALTRVTDNSVRVTVDGQPMGP